MSSHVRHSEAREAIAIANAKLQHAVTAPPEVRAEAVASAQVHATIAVASALLALVEQRDGR